MPTQIPAKTCAGRAEPSGAPVNRYTARERSFLAEAKIILVHSLLAAAIIYVVAFIIVWAYT
jgi:hypothetical protein